MHEPQQDHLQVIANQFITHRGNRSRCAFPDALWQEAFSLSKSYSILQIAEAIHVHPAYVKRKFNSLAQASPSEKPAFVQIKFQPVPQVTSTYLNLKTASGTHVSIHFQMHASELFPLIQALAGVQK